MATPRSDDAPTLDAGEPTLLVDAPCHTGEGVLWHDGEQALYWVDIPTGRLFRYDSASQRNETVYRHDAEIGGFTIQADGSLLLFCTAGRILRWRDGDVSTVIDDIPAERDTRFNDVIADPAGRVFAGTMPADDHPSSLYRLDTDGSITKIFDDLGQANGLGFTADERTLFLTDSGFRALYRLDYDRATGALTNRTPVARTPKENGVPDGLTLDANDMVWSARYGGHGIFRYTTAGELTGFVRMPVRNVTDIAFGGPGLRTAFVSTATGGKERSEELGEQAGSLFSIDLGIQGKPEFRSKVQV